VILVSISMKEMSMRKVMSRKRRITITVYYFPQELLLEIVIQMVRGT
jgi:hypothetical protein